MADSCTLFSAGKALRVGGQLLLLLSILLGVSVHASVENATPHSNPGSVGTDSTQIETTPSPLKDEEIRQRISGIFSEIEGLGAVEVSVVQGVVSLAGETANERKAQQALGLANRLTDVVTVDDHINRTLDIQENVTTAYHGLRARGQNLVKAMPLLLVGFLIFGLVTWFGIWLSNRKTIWQRVTPRLCTKSWLASNALCRLRIPSL